MAMHNPIEALTAPARSQIRRWVLGAFPRDPALAAGYDQPEGDAGLFGPSSATWKVHSDFSGMLSGGLCALMLQTLHPLALAGVWDHSNFREDLVGRLRRTTAFVAATTYAPTAQADALVERVRAIHRRVQGRTADGRAYAADDPALLTWVHVTEAYGFLEGYRRYSHLALPADAADRYYEEVRRVAEALGARDVPASERAVMAYFHSVRDTLEFGERSRVVLGVLSRGRLPVAVAGPSRDLFLGAGAALLPAWAADLLQLGARRRLQARIAARTLSTLSPLVRAALPDGIASRACRRVGVSPDILRSWE
jgi:uncharacterized protein (DUF2236 family)